MKTSLLLILILASGSAAENAVRRPAAPSSASATAAAPGTGPTASEWAPVAEAIRTDAADAPGAVALITSRYPRWPDAWRSLAVLHLRRGKPEDAVFAAKKARDLGDEEGEVLFVRSLAAAGRKAEAVTAAEVSQARDAQGWVRYFGAAAALDGKEPAKARRLLDAALERAGAKPPPEFLFLGAQLAVSANDLVRAEASLAAAVAARPTFWAGWYELGRVRSLRAAGGDAEALAGTVQAFGKVVAGQPDDLDARLGLAAAQLEQARRLAAAGGQDAAGARCRDCLGVLKPALVERPDHPVLRLLAGEAALRAGDWQAAADHLGRARQLGAQDRSLPFNLAQALGNLGRTEEAAQVLASSQASSPGELVAMGRAAFDAGDHQQAAQVLARAAEGLKDPVLQAACWRFVGHAQRLLAGRTPSDPAGLDAAGAAYLKASDLGDWPSRHWYVALEAARSPERAYLAGWRLLGWNGYLPPAGYGLVLANYGAWVSGGQGLAGMLQRHPFHLVAWAVAILLPLGIFLRALLRRRAALRPSAGPPLPAPEAPARPTPGSALIPKTASPKPASRPRPVERSEKAQTEDLTDLAPPPRPPSRRR